MNNYIISFDKSKDDIPTLVVMRESYFIYPFDPTYDVVKTITGDKAVRIFEELTEDGSPLQNDGWIPVSDPLNELPTDRHLLVTVEEDVWHGEKCRYVTELHYDMTEWIESIHDAENTIAYMPYPEPYKEDQND